MPDHIKKLRRSDDDKAIWIAFYLVKSDVELHS